MIFEEFHVCLYLLNVVCIAFWILLHLWHGVFKGFFPFNFRSSNGIDITWSLNPLEPSDPYMTHDFLYVITPRLWIWEAHCLLHKLPYGNRLLAPKLHCSMMTHCGYKLTDTSNVHTILGPNFNQVLSFLKKNNFRIFFHTFVSY